MDFGTLKGTVKVRWACPVIEICSTDMLQFTLSALAVDVFMGLNLEGFPAKREREKKRFL